VCSWQCVTALRPAADICARCQRYLKDVTVALDNNCSLLISLKCVVREVVLVSIVALKTLDISQGSVATHLRCGGIFRDCIITHFLLILTVK